MNYRLVSMTAVAVVFGATAAMAADLGTPKSVADNSAPASTSWNRAYLAVHGGGLWIPDAKAEFVFQGTHRGVFDLDTGYRVGGAIGYNLNSNFGLEGEVSYGQAGLASLSVSGSPGPGVSGDVTTLTVMGNAIYGAQFGAWRPYVGVGAGLAMVGLKDVDMVGTEGADDTDWTWAAQAFVGLDYAMTERVSVGARYRFQRIGDSDMLDNARDPIGIDAFDTHSAEVVLKIGFGG